MADYYAGLLQNIEDYMQKKQYAEAGRLVDEELRMPYVPAEVLKKLEEYQRILRPLLQSEKSLSLLPKDQLVEYLKSDSEKAYRALNSLREANVRNYLTEIQNYLKDEEGDRLMRSLLIQICHLQGINQQLAYLDRSELKTVNPAQIGDVAELAGFGQAWELLRQLLEKDSPSFLQGCHDVLIQEAYRRYPETLGNDTEATVFSIIRYVYRAYGDEAGWQQFAEEHQVRENNLLELCL